MSLSCRLMRFDVLGFPEARQNSIHYANDFGSFS